MNLQHTVKTAYGGLASHKTRSILTTIGIIIGVAAIIVVVSLGNGAQGFIVGTISALGSETAIIQPGGPGTEFGPESLLSDVLTEDDLEAIKRKSNVPNLSDAMPQVFISGNVSYEDESYRAEVSGGTADYFVETFNIYPERGNPFTEEDIESRARVALIGVTVEDELFGIDGSSLGESIEINREKFRVVGIFPKKGSLGFFNVDKTVLVPYTTAQTYITGGDHFNQILLKADSVENVDKMVYDVTATLRETHDIEGDEEDDFLVQTQAGLVEQITVIVGALTAFLGAVVAISLVVGGVGIMNIMLVSVTERTKEIGLRKALGATRKDILRQFLLEAVMLTATGGIIGVLFGTVIAYGASLVLAQVVSESWQFVFPIGGALLGVLVSAGVGLIFGIYPASQASKKSPIEALRYE
jgi:putative ABC transport system permease protein